MKKNKLLTKIILFFIFTLFLTDFSFCDTEGDFSKENKFTSLTVSSKDEISSVISAKKATLDSFLASDMEQKLSYLASKEHVVYLGLTFTVCLLYFYVFPSFNSEELSYINTMSKIIVEENFDNISTGQDKVIYTLKKLSTIHDD